MHGPYYWKDYEGLRLEGVAPLERPLHSLPPFCLSFFSLGHGGMGSAFGLVDLSTAPARSKCIQVRGLSFEPRINK